MHHCSGECIAPPLIRSLGRRERERERESCACPVPVLWCDARVIFTSSKWLAKKLEPYAVLVQWTTLKGSPKHLATIDHLKSTNHFTRAAQRF